MTGDHVKLLTKKLAERIVASTFGYAHTGIMRPGSDKTPGFAPWEGGWERSGGGWGPAGDGTDGTLVPL
jgi:hypothetical protein